MLFLCLEQVIKKSDTKRKIKDSYYSAVAIFMPFFEVIIIIIMMMIISMMTVV